MRRPVAKSSLQREPVDSDQVSRSQGQGLYVRVWTRHRRGALIFAATRLLLEDLSAADHDSGCDPVVVAKVVVEAMEDDAGLQDTPP